MSKSAKENTGRVQVGTLPQKDKELKEKEAESVKGGGGLSGGVINNIRSGEEIPQRNQR